MPSLLERLRQALHPQYLVESELARGGMGVVFLARDPLLDRPVAVKVLAPELATETAARRFLREARLLAQLHHPHIVPVHQVGEKDGLFYFVMDYFGEATLTERMARGALSPDEVLKLGRDVLDALDTAHAHRVVHCDIKPSNIFLESGRALLGDFGIATPPGDGDTTVTDSGVRGTPRYMAPEQFRGEATPQSDIFSLGMVLFEALTGREWTNLDPSTADWSGVPRTMRRTLGRALKPSPSDRWPDARAFRRAWWDPGTGRLPWRAAGLAAGGVGLATLVTWMVMQTGSRRPEDLVRIGTFSAVGPGGVAPVADSVATAFSTALRASPDLQVCRTDACDAPVVLTGTVTMDDGLTIEVTSGEPVPAVFSRRSGPADDWRATTELVTTDILLDLWSTQSPLAAWLPVQALPASADGLTAFIHAERMWHRGEWAEARSAYERTVAIDSSCYLCSWRITEIQRWLTEPPDSAHLATVLRNPDVFSGNYRPLTVARTLPLDQRVSLLDSLVRAQPGFFLARFARGDELLHRGAFLGRLPTSPLEDFVEVTVLSEGFSPVYEHLLWLYTRLGMRDSASAARRRLADLPPPGDMSTVAYRGLLDLGFQMRFDPEAVGASLTEITASDAFRDERIPAAPRLMISFGVPEGAVGFGSLFESMAARPRLQFAGQVAQFVGHVAMGQWTQADAVEDRIFPHRPVFASFAAQVRTVHALFDPDADPREIVDAAELLPRAWEPMAGPTSAVAVESAAWMYRLLQILRPDLIPPQRAPEVTQPALRAVLRSAEAAVREPETGVLILDSLRTLEYRADMPGEEGSPFNTYPLLRAVTHLLRAEWLAHGDVVRAAEALRWHYHLFMSDLPTDDPLPQEADWALGTLAQWLQAELLDRTGSGGPEACTAYREVARHWARGDARYRDKASLARAKLTILNCEPGPG